MIRSIAINIADYISESEQDETQQSIYLYGLELLISSFINTVLVLAIGFISGFFWHTVVFISQYYVIKKTSGGYHASSHERCVITFCILYSLCLAGIRWLEIDKVVWWMIAGWVVSGIIVFVLAPVEDRNKPLDETEKTIFSARSRKSFIIYSIIDTGVLLFAIPQLQEYLVFAVMALNWIGAVLITGEIKNTGKYNRRT